MGARIGWRNVGQRKVMGGIVGAAPFGGTERPVLIDEGFVAGKRIAGKEAEDPVNRINPNTIGNATKRATIALQPATTLRTSINGARGQHRRREKLPLG